MRRHDTPLEFDLELAKRQSMDNPVYYVQYGHARCAAIQRRAAALEAPRARRCRRRWPPSWRCPRRSRSCAGWPTSRTSSPTRPPPASPTALTTYLTELAGEFQSYYTRLQKVHGDTILPQERHRTGDWRATWNWRKTAARLYWVEAIASGDAQRAGAARASPPPRRWRARRIRQPRTPQHERGRFMTCDTLRSKAWKSPPSGTSIETPSAGATRSRCASTTARSSFCSSAAPSSRACCSCWA